MSILQLADNKLKAGFGPVGAVDAIQRVLGVDRVPFRIPRSRLEQGGFVFPGCVSYYRLVCLFLITQQFSLRVPDLQSVPVDYVMI